MADKRFVGDQDQLSEIDRTRVDRILVDGDAARDFEANRLIYPGPGSLVLTPGDLPDKIERQQRVQDIEATGKLSDAELRVLVASQKAMAAQVPALLRSHGAESAWIAKVEALLADSRPIQSRADLLDYLISYWRVAALGAIVLNAPLARGRLVARGSVPPEMLQSLDRLDAYWKRGERGSVQVEELLLAALELGASTQRSGLQRLWEELPDWGKGGVVVAGVLGATLGVFGLLRAVAMGLSPNRSNA